MKRAILLLALGVPTSLAAQNTVVSTYVAADDGVLLFGQRKQRAKALRRPGFALEPPDRGGRAQPGRPAGQRAAR